jgi:hypothetical protein
MNINKAHWNTSGDNIRLSMPIGKVDVERRIVSGFATLDNIDKQNDIVTTESSINAFKNFRGNLREMHQPIAIGKVLSFKEDRYFDPNTKKFYNGVYVSAYVSKGAQDTWEKVLDGTYTGFSIGGDIKSWDDAFNEEMNKSIRVIKEYDLFELSLVDNPANQFANILSIEKSSGKAKISEGVEEVVLENVFWDSENGIVSVSEDDTAVSPVSGKEMKNIGFVEKNDNEKPNMIKFLVDSAKGISTIKMTKEANPMTEDTNVVVEDVKVETEVIAIASDAEPVNNVEVAPETQTEEETPTLDESVAAAEENVGESPKNDSEADEPQDIVDVKKSVDTTAEVVADLKDSLTNAFGDLAAAIKSINDQVAELTKSLSNVTSEVAAVTKDVSSVKDNFNEFGKRVDAVEADTAFRKSGDLGEIVQFEPVMTQKSLWGGRFLKNTDLLI